MGKKTNQPRSKPNVYCKRSYKKACSKQKKSTRQEKTDNADCPTIKSTTWALQKSCIGDKLTTTKTLLKALNKNKPA